MTAHRAVRLFCDHRDDPAEGQRFGRPCGVEFYPDSGFLTSVAAMRREAAKAGWAYVRHQNLRVLDKDYCPAHKERAAQADAAETETTP